MKTYVYEFGDSLYINLTNRCSNACEFCIRNFKKGVGDNDLRLNAEPSFDDVKEDLSTYDLKKYKELVFCGFGEPMYALPVLSQVAPYLKRLGCKTRINTNGQAALINKRDDIPKLISSYSDAVSISLNASTASGYQEICRSKFGEEAFKAMLEFAKGCVENGIDTTLSVVDFIGEDEIEACRNLAKDIGAHFRVRESIHEDDEY